MSDKKTPLLVAILIAIISFFVFSQANIKPENMMQETSITPQVTVTPNSKIIEIEAGSFYFKPDKLVLKKGETVTLKFKAVSMMHNLLIDGLGLSIPVTKSGETSEIEFTPDKVGTFQYYCSIGSHKASGQIGTLTVTE